MSKVGRNDPCPCGSGKKYKKCCSQKSPMQKRLFTRLDSGAISNHKDKVSGLVSEALKSDGKKEEEEEEEKNLAGRLSKEGERRRRDNES